MTPDHHLPISALIKQIAEERTIENFSYMLKKLLDMLRMYPDSAIYIFEKIFVDGKYFIPSKNNSEHKYFRETVDTTKILHNGLGLYALPAMVINILFNSEINSRTYDITWQCTLEKWWHMRCANGEYFLRWDNNCPDGMTLDNWIDNHAFKWYHVDSEAYTYSKLSEFLGERE